MANELAALRESQGLTQTEVAQAVGVSQQAVSQWESGKKIPKSIFIKKLAQVLASTTDKILDYVSNVK